jgi:hypothetical protein
MKDNHQYITQEPTKLIKVRPENFTLNNFTFDKLYTDRIQIKNLMNFPIVLNVRSSDENKLQVSEKIVKLNGKQMARVGFTVRIKTHIRTTCIRNLYIWIHNDLIDYKYYLTLNTKDSKVVAAEAQDRQMTMLSAEGDENVLQTDTNQVMLTEIPEITEPVLTDMRDGYHTHENFKNKYITIEGLSSDRNYLDHHYSDEITPQYKRLREENHELMTSHDGFINKTQQFEDTVGTFKSDYEVGRTSSQSPGKGLNRSNRSQEKLIASKTSNVFSCFSGKDTAYNSKLDSQFIEKRNNISALNEIKQSYVDLVYNNYTEHKKRNNEILSIMDNLIDLTNSNLTQVCDYNNYESIKDNAKRIEGAIRKFKEGLQIHDKQLSKTNDPSYINKKLDSGYLNIDFDSLQVELAKLDSYENEIANLKTAMRRLEVENDYLKTNNNMEFSQSKVLSSDRSTDVLRNENTHLKAENIRKQELINSKEDFIYKKEEEMRQLRRNYERLITDKSTRNRDTIDRREVNSMIAEKDKTIYELKENIMHSTNVIQNLKEIVESKTSQIIHNSNPYEHASDNHYVTLIESLKRDIKCKDQIIADLCDTEKRGHEIISDLKSLSTSMRNEQLERTMMSLTDEIEKQKLRNSVSV